MFAWKYSIDMGTSTLANRKCCRGPRLVGDLCVTACSSISVRGNHSSSCPHSHIKIHRVQS